MKDLILNKTIIYGWIPGYTFPKMKFYLIIILFISIRLNAQTVDIINTSVSWTTSNATNLDKPNDQFSFNCQFVTNGLKPIKWIQGEGAETTEFSILTTEGQWKDISKDGQIIFHVSQDETRGTITIKQKAGKAILIMDLGEGSRYKFEIGNYKRLY